MPRSARKSRQLSAWERRRQLGTAKRITPEGDTAAGGMPWPPRVERLWLCAVCGERSWHDVDAGTPECAGNHGGMVWVREERTVA